MPIIQVDPGNYFAVSSGVWFTAPAVTGPWRVATSVPNVIYTIPTSSVVHFVTYVRIYGATPEVVYVGYTPGYMGTVVGPYGTVVYGTGYTYAPWVGSVWYPPPYTYGVAAVPVYNPARRLHLRLCGGPGHGRLGDAVLRRGLPPVCLLRQRHRQRVWPVRQHRVLGHEDGLCRRRRGGRLGQRQLLQQGHRHVSGNYSTNKSYNANTGVAKQTGAVSGTGAAGGTGTAAAGRSYNTETGQRSYASTGSATGAGGSSIDHTGATTAGPQGYDHTGSTTTTNAKTGETKTWGSGSAANDHYADASGNVYKGSESGGWQQHSESGSWNKPTGDTSSMDRESQARSSGEQRASSFSGGGGRFGGGGGGRRR